MTLETLLLRLRTQKHNNHQQKCWVLTTTVPWETFPESFKGKQFEVTISFEKGSPGVRSPGGASEAVVATGATRNKSVRADSRGTRRRPSK